MPARMVMRLMGASAASTRANSGSSQPTMKANVPASAAAVPPDDRNAWALYAVSDARAARDWLQGAAAVFNSQAGVTATATHLVETA